ncbi:hypothetical protein TNCV_4656861 [Trichonephila clavipes]|nr:hypothetical protein TNCV_4656861 [Trichonephila clavipes]
MNGDYFKDKGTRDNSAEDNKRATGDGPRSSNEDDMAWKPQLWQMHFAVSSELKNIIDADSEDENEMNNAAPAPRHPK